MKRAILLNILSKSNYFSFPAMYCCSRHFIIYSEIYCTFFIYFIQWGLNDIVSWYIFFNWWLMICQIFSNTYEILNKFCLLLKENIFIREDHRKFLSKVSLYSYKIYDKIFFVCIHYFQVYFKLYCLVYVNFWNFWYATPKMMANKLQGMMQMLKCDARKNFF